MVLHSDERIRLREGHIAYVQQTLLYHEAHVPPWEWFRRDSNQSSQTSSS
jgi:hypothetical protein